MKRIKLDISEFLHFRQIAEKYRILFPYGIKKGWVTVQAQAAELEIIGY